MSRKEERGTPFPLSGPCVQWWSTSLGGQHLSAVSGSSELSLLVNHFPETMVLNVILVKLHKEWWSGQSLEVSNTFLQVSEVLWWEGIIESMEWFVPIGQSYSTRTNPCGSNSTLFFSGFFQKIFITPLPMSRCVFHDTLQPVTIGTSNLPAISSLNQHDLSFLVPDHPKVDAMTQCKDGRPFMEMCSQQLPNIVVSLWKESF
jgi:hypothetical protein